MSTGPVHQKFQHKFSSYKLILYKQSSKHSRTIRIYTLTKVQCSNTHPQDQYSENSSINSLHINWFSTKSPQNTTRLLELIHFQGLVLQYTSKGPVLQKFQHKVSPYRLILYKQSSKYNRTIRIYTLPRSSVWYTSKEPKLRVSSIQSKCLTVFT